MMEALDNYVHAGSAKVVHEYRQSYGEDRSTGLELLKRGIRMLKGGG
jgi:hypothetical protein